MAYLLGIDVGTSGTRALLVDARSGKAQGRVVAAATAAHVGPGPLPAGWSEQDPRDWWRATRRAVRRAIAAAKINPGEVKAVGLSGQMHGAVLLGEGSMTPLRPAILWNDQRTAKQCDQIERAAGGRAKLIAMVGNPALTGFTAPKLLWVRQREPRVYARVRHVLLPKDYLRLCMTGERATDVGDASGTLLFDVAKRRWNTTLVDRLQIDRAVLPRVVESQEVTGLLTRAAARELGLAEGTPVVGGSGDQPAGAVGSGVVRRGIVSATIGTSGVVFAPSDRPVYDPQGRVHTMCSAVAGAWCVFGCMLSAGGSLQWFRNQLGREEMISARRSGRDAYELLVDVAMTTPPGCNGLLFLPYLTGERCPYPDPEARGGWIGITTQHNRAAMVRSVLEGVTFGMADALAILRAMKIPVTRVRLSGGGARSAFWRQLQADVYGCPVATTQTQEGPAYGAAILAGVGAGVWRDVPEACDAVVRETEVLRPERKKAALYRRAHARFQRLYPALKNEFTPSAHPLAV